MNSKQSNATTNCPAPFQLRVLLPADAEAYRAVRMEALVELPSAFGALPGDEPDADEIAARREATDDRCFFGVFQDGRLTGIVRFSRYSSANEKHRAYFAGLYVLPGYRGKGLGRAFVRAVLDRAADSPGIRRMNLTVVIGQIAAIRLYESFGFRTYATELETFSCEGKFFDEHLMTLALASQDDSK